MTKGRVKAVKEPEEPVQSSKERLQDVVFEDLIKDWTELREFQWVQAANWMYGHILEQRELNADPAQSPEGEIIEGVIVDE